jgi:aminoglycoside phosphotransferase (APT) family kinase protein
VQFSADSTREPLRKACAAIGHPDADVRLLRLGENAIYRISGTPIVVRIARSLDALDDVRKEVRVARWLEAEDVPAARLADESEDEPLVVDGHPITFWRFIAATDPDPELADLGGLLRHLHALEPPEWLRLPSFSPFVRVAERLDRAPAAANADDVDFLRELFSDLQVAYQQLVFVFLPSPVHGDAHLANLMRDESGQVVMLDFEAFAYGHREWDLTVTGARRDGFGWLDASQYRQFTDAYGYDILSWPGFPVLRSIRELTMTTWLMQLTNDQRAADEFRRRVSDMREGKFPRRWAAF